MVLAAAMAAFPAPFRERLRGLLIGGGLAYVLSVARLVALHYTLERSPAAAEPVHQGAKEQTS